VIFDLGDTLLHTKATDWSAADRRLLELANDTGGMTAEDVKRLSDEIAAEVFGMREQSSLELHYGDFVKLLCETLGISLSVSYFEAACEMWRAAVTMAPVEGIVPALETLASRAVKMAVLSNSSFPGVVLGEELAKQDMGRFFSFVISSADYGVRKPHRRIVDLVVKKMALPREEVWFAGDKLEFDVAGAVNSGLCAVWYNPGHKPRTAGHECLEISHWHELAQMIGELSNLSRS
jgi:putative hydrolase of the HAD superfamily